MIGYALCGSFCTHAISVEKLKLFSSKLELLPIVSFNASSLDTRFGRATDLMLTLESITGHVPVSTIERAEELGPKIKLDALIIAPCTGNTLAKLACGITDTPVTMAAKAHLRSDRPLIIALATNDAMSANLPNIGKLMSRKNVYFTPMVQDDPISKPHSLVADFDLLWDTYTASVVGTQLRPIFREKV